MNDLVQESWEDVVAWNIPLSQFTGVTLSNIQRVYLGFGNRNSPVAGSAGTVYIDQIFLYPSRCVPAINQGGDIGYYEWSNCQCDWYDAATLAGDWLDANTIVTAQSPITSTSSVLQI